MTTNRHRLTLAMTWKPSSSHRNLSAQMLQWDRINIHYSQRIEAFSMVMLLEGLGTF